MPCIFCDQTPETVNAVDTLTDSKKWLGLSPGASNDAIKARVAHLQLDLSDAKYEVTRWRERYNQVAQELETRKARQWEPEPFERTADEWASLMPLPMFKKPNGTAGKWAMDVEPYNVGKSKKDRFK